MVRKSVVTLLGRETSYQLLPEIVRQFDIIIQHIVSKIVGRHQELEVTQILFIQGVIETLSPAFDRAFLPTELGVDALRLMSDLTECANRLPACPIHRGQSCPCNSDKLELQADVSELIGKLWEAVPDLAFSALLVDRIISWADGSSQPSYRHEEVLATMLRCGTKESRLKMSHHRKYWHERSKCAS